MTNSHESVEKTCDVGQVPMTHAQVMYQIHQPEMEIISSERRGAELRDGPYIVTTIDRVVTAYKWNPVYNQDAECQCGHTYHRHFDSYEHMDPVGCKYCDCGLFRPEE